MNRIIIVVIEDDPDVRSVLESLFESQDYESHFYASGEEALPEVARIKPSLVILDILMVGMSGFELCRKIRASEETDHIPVLAISGYDTQEYRRKIVECGANDYLSKPFELKAMLAHIQKLAKPRPTP